MVRVVRLSGLEVPAAPSWLEVSVLRAHANPAASPNLFYISITSRVFGTQGHAGFYVISSSIPLASLGLDAFCHLHMFWIRTSLSGSFCKVRMKIASGDITNNEA